MDVPENKRRIALALEYQGTAYCGWQRQLNAPSLQQSLEEALEDLTGEPGRVTVAGRTDAGVHARGQVVAFFTTRPWEADVFRRALRTRLPEDMGVTRAWEAPSCFNPRRDAVMRTYIYRLSIRAAPPIIERHTRAWYPGEYDFDLIREAARRLVGAHEFSGFRSSKCDAKRTRLTLSALEWRETDKGLWEVEICGRSFLHNMVRIIVGTVLEIGRHAMTLDDMLRVLETGDRALAGPTAKACGLTLERVDYPLGKAFEL